MTLSRPVLYAALALSVLSLASCGGGGPKLYPVRGAVFYQNAPAEGAVVVFHPTGSQQSSALKPSGTVGPDGSFSLSTYPHGPGAPSGDYIVLVTWYPSNAREVDNPKNKLPDRYASFKASPLRASVKDGPTDLEPFRLTR